VAYPQFDRKRLHLLPLSEPPPLNDPQLEQIADRIVQARKNGRPVILMMGAHVIKRGLSRYVIDLMERDLITHVGGNGACSIHDYELALVGATTESVAYYLPRGQFGLWQETGGINEAVNHGIKQGLGFGEAVGQAIEDGEFPHRDISILAAGYRLQLPVTIHIGIGQDIIHPHPNFDPAAAALASYRDFLTFAHALVDLEGGVFLNYGTAVMGPEVFQKALSMARNVVHQNGKRIEHFTTAVFDLIDLGPDIHHESPKDKASYYFRPYKSILVRAVEKNGISFYVREDHQITLPNLYRLILEKL